MTLESAGRGDPRRNAILRQLADADRQALLGASSLVPIIPGRAIVSTATAHRAVYFPLKGIASFSIELEDGAAIDAAIIGAEGVLQVPPYVEHFDLNITLRGQLPGEALAVSQDVFEAQTRRSAQLGDLVMRHRGLMIGALSMSIACARFHEVRRQYARWILAFHDHAGHECFPVTQDLLGSIIGVRRATITSIAQRMKQEGMIDYRRGEVCIRDRKGLEAVACECYHTLQASYRQIFQAL